MNEVGRVLFAASSSCDNWCCMAHNEGTLLLKKTEVMFHPGILVGECRGDWHYSTPAIMGLWNRLVFNARLRKFRAHYREEFKLARDKNFATQLLAKRLQP